MRIVSVTMVQNSTYGKIQGEIIQFNTNDTIRIDTSAIFLKVINFILCESETHYYQQEGSNISTEENPKILRYRKDVEGNEEFLTANK